MILHEGRIESRILEKKCSFMLADITTQVFGVMGFFKRPLELESLVQARLVMLVCDGVVSAFAVVLAGLD